MVVREKSAVRKKGGFMTYQNTPKMHRTLSQHARIHDAQT